MNSMIDEKHKEIIRDNFLEWARKELKVNTEEPNDIIGFMYIAWLEATKQAEIRNSIK